MINSQAKAVCKLPLSTKNASQASDDKVDYKAHYRQVLNVIAPYLSIACACTIVSLWLGTLVILVRSDLTQLSPPAIAFSVLGRTFLHTGLFILAHDAAHGTIFPQCRPLNDSIGAWAIRLYALLPYQKFVQNHGKHHRSPASPEDPDFHAEGYPQAVPWYFKFMRTYLDRQQIAVLGIGMTMLFHSVRFLLAAPVSNLLLFWILPMVLSSIQLFYFGTYLPHRQPSGGYANHHAATSSDLPVFWSLLTCYHFGYHWEHHEYPHLPWFRLPSVYNLNNQLKQ